MSGRGDKKNAVGQKGLWCKKKKKKIFHLVFFLLLLLPLLLSVFKSSGPLEIYLYSFSPFYAFSVHPSDFN